MTKDGLYFSIVFFIILGLIALIVGIVKKSWTIGGIGAGIAIVSLGVGGAAVTENWK